MPHAAFSAPYRAFRIVSAFEKQSAELRSQHGDQFCVRGTMHPIMLQMVGVDDATSFDYGAGGDSGVNQIANQVAAPATGHVSSRAASPRRALFCSLRGAAHM